MRIKILAFFFFITAIPSSICSMGSFVAGLYQDNKGGNLNYSIYIPNELSEESTIGTEFGYPLLLFFHGSGRRGRDSSLY